MIVASQFQRRGIGRRVLGGALFVVATALTAACDDARSPASAAGDCGGACGGMGGAGTPATVAEAGIPSSGGSASMFDASVVEDFVWLERKANDSLFYPDTVRVDPTHVFFNESNLDGFRILRADKAGRVAVDLAARGDNVQTNSLELDDEAFYTVDANSVRWAPKAGGSGGSVVFDVSVRQASILVDSMWLYLADHGCKTIRAISKADQSVRATVVIEVQGEQGGGTALAQDDEAVYCSGAGYRVLVRMAKVDGQYTIVASGDDVSYAAKSSAGTDFGGIAVSADAIYWIVNQSGAAVGQALVKLPKAGGAVETLVEVDVNGKNGVLRFDTTRDTLYWVSGASRRGAVVSYRVADGTLTLLANNRIVRRGLDMDADYLYWSEDGGIMRLAKP